MYPLWSAKTTGNWRLTPQVLYTREYLPYDKPGSVSTARLRRTSCLPVTEFMYSGFYNEHVKHTVANLPKTAYQTLFAPEKIGRPSRSRALRPRSSDSASCFVHFALSRLAFYEDGAKIEIDRSLLNAPVTK